MFTSQWRQKWLKAFGVIVGLVVWPQLLWAQGVLELPAPASVQSGISLIKGWVCNAKVVELQLDEEPRSTAVYKLSRGDTQQDCGDADNGFASLVNWNSVGEGLHTVRVFADGVQFAQVAFTVTTLDLG